MAEELLPASGSTPPRPKRERRLSLFDLYWALMVVGGVVAVGSGNLAGFVGFGLGMGNLLIRLAGKQLPRTSTYRFGRARPGERGWGRFDTIGLVILVSLAVLGAVVAAITRSGWAALLAVLIAYGAGQVSVLIGAGVVMLRRQGRATGL